MELLFIADGPRDKAAVPKLVEKLLDTSFDSQFSSWKQIRLTRGHGYARRLKFAMNQARDRGLDGVAATLDTDKVKHGDRLEQLQSARLQDREDATRSFLPTALGEANPHLEAWLIDDPAAVRSALGLTSDHEIRSVNKCDPKGEFNTLVDQSEKDDPLAALEEIASGLDLDRCNHKDHTGLKAFAREVHDELSPLVEA